MLHFCYTQITCRLIFEYKLKTIGPNLSARTHISLEKTLTGRYYFKIFVVIFLMLISRASKGFPNPWLSSSTKMYFEPATFLDA